MKIEWKQKEISALKEADVPIDFNADLSDEQLEVLYEVVQDRLEDSGFAGIWENILTAVAEAMSKRRLLAGQ